MRLTLSILAIVAALVLCGVSMVMNYLFLSSLGKSPLEGQVLGLASAAADILKTLLPFFVAWAWSARRMIATLTGSLVWIFFAGFSLMSAIGFAAENRAVITAERAALSESYTRLQHDLTRAEKRLAGLPAHRPRGIVVATIQAHKQNSRWTATNSCTNATASKSRSYCAAHFALQAELAAGTEADSLRNTINELQTTATRRRDSGAAHNNDPQVAPISRISGLGEETIRLTLIIAVALLVEMGSSLGLFLAGSHGLPGAQQPMQNQILPPSEPANDNQKPVGCIEDFCLEELMRDEAGGLNSEEIQSAYANWSARHGLKAMPSDAFENSFDELMKAVGLKKCGGRYLGIGIRENSMPLPMPKSNS